MNNTKKLIVFKTAEQIAKHNEKGSFYHRRFGHIPVDEVIFLTLPPYGADRRLPSIPLDDSFLRRIRSEAAAELLNRAFRYALNNGWYIKKTIWYDAWEREEGVPGQCTYLHECLDDFEDQNDVASELLEMIGEEYDSGGCAEIIIGNQKEEYPLYHHEQGDVYLLREISQFV